MITLEPRPLLTGADFSSKEEREQLFANSVVVGVQWTYCGNCGHTMRTTRRSCSNCNTFFIYRIMDESNPFDNPEPSNADERQFPKVPLVGKGSGSVLAGTFVLL